jgi:glycine cleavage system H protein
MAIPTDLRYSKDHEWTRVDGDRAVVGITDYAQEQLGDIVYVELPAVGARVRAGEAFGVVESVKAVSDLYAPVSGEVVEVNQEMADHPEWVNQDPYGKAWLIAVIMDDPREADGLLDAAGYEVRLAQEEA